MMSLSMKLYVCVWDIDNMYICIYIYMMEMNLTMFDVQSNLENIGCQRIRTVCLAQLQWSYAGLTTRWII